MNYFRRFRYKVHIRGELYLVRYRLLKTPWFSIYLHHILRSDDERALHDHPFNFTSLLLWGRYTEWRPGPEGPEPEYQVPTHRGWLSIGRRKAADLHRITLEKPVWTLFIRGPVIREWGFQTSAGWVPYKTFVDRTPNESWQHVEVDAYGKPLRPIVVTEQSAE